MVMHTDAYPSDAVEFIGRLVGPIPSTVVGGPLSKRVVVDEHRDVFVCWESNASIGS